MEEKKVYKIDDIARELGVSKTTVSRAISGKGRIGKETRERVLAFIEEHDYRPNVIAKSLAQNKTYNLGLILPADFVETEFSFFKECMNGICEVAERYNYDVLITMGTGENLSHVRRLVHNRKVDGIILSRAVTDPEIPRYLKMQEMPFVVIGPSDDPDIITVDNQNQEASEELTEIMLLKGVHRMALLGGTQSHKVTEKRFRGFVRAYEKNGISMEYSPVILEISNNHVMVMKAVERALEAGVDGILCMDDVICALVMSCLREKNVRVPDDIKLASLYDSERLEYNDPPITSAHFDTKKLGHNAGLKLLDALGETIEEEELALTYQVVLRKSTAVSEGT